MLFLRFKLSKVELLLFFLTVSTCSILPAQNSASFGYGNNAISIDNTGDIIEGHTAIFERNKVKGIEERAYKPAFGVVANRDSSYYYEIGKFYSGGDIYGYVQVLELSSQGKKVELEFYTETSDFKSALVEVDKRRREWVQLCNAHHAAALINELYSENTMYYNHKPLVVGRPGLIQNYQYMNRESYSLNLIPLKTEQVSDDIVLEIGQCSGSYGGKYIIVWKKNTAGKWEVLLDSNI